MIELVQQLLNENQEVSDYEIKKTITKSSQLFYVLDQLETNRITHNTDLNVTVYHDFEEYRGSSSFILNASDDGESIKDKINHAIETCKKVKNPYFHLKMPTREAIVEVKSIESENFNESCCKVADAIMKANHYQEGWINSVEIFLNHVIHRFINSKGVDLCYEKTTCEIEIIPTWKSAHEEIELYLNVKLMELDYDEITSKVEEVLKQAKYRSEAVALSEEMKHVPVLIQDEMMGVIMDNLAYNLNFSSVYNKANHYQKEDMICPYHFKMSVTPYVEKAVNSIPFDNHGVILKEHEIIHDGKVTGYWGDLMHGQYLNEDIISGSSRVFKVETDHREDFKLPYLEICNFSSPQLEESTGYFGGEVRLALYHDTNNKIVPITGFSVAGNIYEDIKEATFSKENVVLNNYAGPKYICFRNMQIS